MTFLVPFGSLTDLSVAPSRCQSRPSRCQSSCQSRPSHCQSSCQCQPLFVASPNMQIYLPFSLKRCQSSCQSRPSHCQSSCQCQPLVVASPNMQIYLPFSLKRCQSSCQCQLLVVASHVLVVDPSGMNFCCAVETVPQLHTCARTRFLTCLCRGQNCLTPVSCDPSGIKPLLCVLTGTKKTEANVPAYLSKRQMYLHN